MSKLVVSRRYYPWYYGKRNTNYSYRSFYICSEIRKGTSDYIIGSCDDSISDGWIKGIRGAYAARTSDSLKYLKNFKYL